MMTKKDFGAFILLVSDDPRDLFWYFNTSELHGLNFEDCCRRLQEGGSYIEGMSNISPIHNKPFIFLNKKTMCELPVWKTAFLIYHEAMHCVLHLHETHFERTQFKDFWNMEENLIQGAEDIAIRICEELDFPEIYLLLKPKDKICKICQN
jgi:hypothetical protein